MIYNQKYLKLADQDVKCVKGGIWDVDSYLARRFWKLFRLPYAEFYDLHQTLIQEGVWEDGYVKGAVPFELVDSRLLLLGSLAFLGCAITWEHISDSNGCSVGHNRDFFREFVEWGHMKAKETIRLPSNIDDVPFVSRDYEIRLFPGCVGSMDGVHFRWDGCPAGLRNECTGRSKKPTVAFQMVVDHNRRFIGVSKGKKFT